MASDEPTTEVFGLTEILRVLRRRWRWVLGGIVIVVALALTLSLQQSRSYAATARVLLNTPVSTDLAGLGGAAQVAQLYQPDRVLANAIQVIESSEVRDRVEAAYEGSLDVSDVEAAIAELGSDAVDITATGGDADGAAALANLYADEYVDYSRSTRVQSLAEVAASLQSLAGEVSRQRDELAAPLTEVDAQLLVDPTNQALLSERATILAEIGPQIEALDASLEAYTSQIEALRAAQNVVAYSTPLVVADAEPPSEPESPKPVRDGVIGLMMGIGVGVVAAFSREFFDESISSTDSLERTVHGAYPLLAVIPEADTAEVATFTSPTSHSPAAEAYRALRTAVRFSALDRPMQVIQVTSGSAAEGKTTTVVNLAVMLVSAGHRVAIACCDLRRPAVHERFGLPVSPGLADVVLGECSLADAVRPVGENLYVLSAGTHPPNPSELLGTARAENVISALAGEMDYVIVDTAPVLPVTDAVVVSRFCDASIVVVGSGRTRRRDLQKTIRTLEQASAQVAGVVLNRAADSERNEYGYQYYTYGGGGGAKDDDGAGAEPRQPVSSSTGG